MGSISKRKGAFSITSTPSSGRASKSLRSAKRWFSWTDTYGMDLVSGEDDVLILATAVVIDMVCHQESKRD
jgi:uncharacterized protein YxjI